MMTSCLPFLDVKIMVDSCLLNGVSRLLAIKAIEISKQNVPWDEYCKIMSSFLEELRLENAPSQKPEKVTPSPIKNARMKNISTTFHGDDFSILTCTSLGLPQCYGGFPPLFFVRGNREIVGYPTATVLNSRKPRLVDPKDEWVNGTVYLSRKFIKDKYCLVSSTGTSGYDILSYIAWKEKCPLLIILDQPLPFWSSNSLSQEFTKKYGWLMEQENILFLSPFPSSKILPRKRRMVIRDRLVVSVARTVAIAAITDSGNMYKLASEIFEHEKVVWVFRPRSFNRLTSGNKKILNKFQVSRPVTPEKIPPNRYSGSETDHKKYADPDRIISRFPENYLTHFTRRCPGPWPGQSYPAYLESLTAGLPEAHHTAFETLRHILREGTVRAGTKIIRGNVPVVSLTECTPDEIMKITKWNRALIRWTFEPYGIAFPKDAVRQLGARPAIYGDNLRYSKIPTKDRYLFQLDEPAKHRWKQEKEWRIRGDLRISSFETGDVLIIVKKEKEALKIINDFPYRVYIMGK